MPTVSTPERISEPDLYENFVGGVANHEAKLALLARMWLQPDHYFSQNAMWHDLKEAHGEFAGWVPAKPIAFQYCDLSLGPVGCVVKGRVEGRLGPVDAYCLSEEGKDFGVPFAGYLLDWSERYPDISLQQVLGGTASTGKDGLRVPMVRVGILTELATSSTGDLSSKGIKEIADYLETDSERISNNIGDMEQDGLITVDRKEDLEDRTIIIANPDYRHLSRKFSELQPLTRATYAVMQKFWQQGIKEVPVKEFIAALAEDGQVSLASARGYLGRAHAGHALPGLINTLQETKTQVSIKPVYRAAIEALMEIMLEFQNPSRDTLEKGKLLAQQIATDPARLSKLMAKARAYSNNALAVDPLDRKRKVIDILEGAESPISIGDLRDRISTDGRRKVGTETVKRWIAALEEEGAVDTLLMPQNPFSKRLGKFVTLAAQTRAHT